MTKDTTNNEKLLKRIEDLEKQLTITEKRLGEAENNLVSAKKEMSMQKKKAAISLEALEIENKNLNNRIESLTTYSRSYQMIRKIKKLVGK